MSTAFSHGNDAELEVKRQFLALASRHLARSATEEDPDTAIAFELSAALTYMNFADYLAEHVARGVSHLAKVAVSKYYFGQITVTSLPQKGMNIEDSIRHLKKFTFPRKDDIIDLLQELNKRRNKVAHEILKTRPEDLQQIDEAIKDLAEKTNELVDVVDEIQMGMPPKSLLELAQQNDSTKEEKK